MKIVPKMKFDFSLIAILAIWLAVLIFVVAYTLSCKAASGEQRRIPVYSVECEEKKIALTFNCAWGDDGADELLDLLSAENIKCTFFFVGEFCEKYPEAVQKIYADGHEIGNHSMHHIDPVKQNFNEILSDINACNELLFSLTGVFPSLYRAPSGSYDNKTIEAAQNLGMTAVQWDVDSIDWKDPTAKTIVERVTDKVKNGSIVLMHLGKENSLAALPEILKRLKKEGYSFVTVGELLIPEPNYIDHAGRLHTVSD